MPNRAFDVVSSALNFSTPDLHVIGGCDLYTTKPAGTDKKLTKSIENGLEEQYKTNLQLSKSLSPPQAQMIQDSLNLSRSSPFGNLGVLSSRRTYAYLIATLNASHPDYDFSRLLKPSDFKHERRLRVVMNNLDTMMISLRPRPLNAFLSVPGITPGSACPPPGQTHWGPGIWKLIDQQMSLKECEIFRYDPGDWDPFEDDDETSLWSIHYFFFNKTRKRVCYLYLRGVSGLSHSPSNHFMTPVKAKRFADDESEGWLTPDLGARKRAKYWLGDHDDIQVAPHDDEEPLHDLHKTATNPSEDEEGFSPPKRPVVDEHDNYLFSDEDARSARSRSKSTIRGISEEIVGRIEV